MPAQKVTLRLDEIDQVVEHWPGEIITPVQLSSGPLGFLLDGASDENMSVFRLAVEPRIADHVYIDGNRTRFILVDQSLVHDGVEVAPPALLLTRSGQEFRTMLTPHFRSTEFVFSNDLLVHCSLGSLAACLDRAIVQLTARMAGRLKAVAAGFIEASEHEQRQTPEISTRLASSQVLKVLCSVIAERTATCFYDDSYGTPVRSSLAYAALAEVDRVGVRDVDVPHLLTHLGVSRRSLEKSFEKSLGISPAQYLLASRLNLIRGRLLNPGTRVADCMFDAGLHDPSRAARQYRRLFGELPSHTLHRVLTRVSGRGKPATAGGLLKPAAGRKSTLQDVSHFA